MISRVRIRAEWLLILLLSRVVVGYEITYEVDVRDHMITRLGGSTPSTAPLLPAEGANTTGTESDESSSGAPNYVMIYSDSPHAKPAASDHLWSHGLVDPSDYGIELPDLQASVGYTVVDESDDEYEEMMAEIGATSYVDVEEDGADPLPEVGKDYSGFEVPVTLAPVVSSGGLVVEPPQEERDGGLTIAVTLAPVVSSGGGGDVGIVSLPFDGSDSPGSEAPNWTDDDDSEPHALDTPGIPSPPTAQPTTSTPSRDPTGRPSNKPSGVPTSSPTARPTRPLQPSRAPWISPTYDEFIAYKNSIRGASNKGGEPVVSLASGYTLHDGNKDGSDLPPNGAVILGTRAVTIESNETLREKDVFQVEEKFDTDVYDEYVLAQEKLARLDTALHMQIKVCFPQRDCGHVNNSTSDFEGAFVDQVCGQYCKEERYEHTLTTLGVCDGPPEEPTGCISFGLTVQLETEEEAQDARREIGAAIAGSFDVFSALLPSIVTGGLEVVDTSINRNVGGGTWYPAWGSAGGGQICSDDGNEPFYMKLNPDEYLAKSKVDCCRMHWWWDVRGCADPTALPCPEGYNPVSEIYREGLMAGAFYGVYPNVYYPGCEGVKEHIDPEDYRDTLGLMQGKRRERVLNNRRKKKKEKKKGEEEEEEKKKGRILTADQEQRKAEYEAKTRAHRELRQEDQLRRLVERQRRLEKFMRPGARKAPIDGDELVVRRYR